MSDSIGRLDPNIAIVLSAGRGSRMHSDIPKQYMDLCGRPVLAWSLEAFQNFDGVDTVILVTGRDDVEWCRKEIIDKYRYDKVKMIVPGGAERYLSVWEGLKAAGNYLRGTDRHLTGSPVSEQMTSVCGSDTSLSADWEGSGVHGQIIFIHDGARPLIDRYILERALDGALRYHACVVGMPARDTIKISDAEGFACDTPDRRYVWQVQTPQAFSFDLIYRSYEKLIADGITDVTDDAMVVEKESDVSVKLIEGSWRNIKITTPEDMLTAEAYLKKMR